MMDDEVVRMLIFKGRLVSGEQGLRGNFCFYLFMFLFCFKQQQEAEVPCSQLAKKFRIRARKKIGRGEGEKRKKSSKKTQVSKYIRKSGSVPPVTLYTHHKLQVYLKEHTIKKAPHSHSPQERILPRSSTGHSTPRPTEGATPGAAPSHCRLEPRTPNLV